MIETERLLLRPMTMDDVELFVGLHADPRVYRFVSAFTRAQAAERLERDGRQWAERGFGLCAVELKTTGEFIGRCGLKYWSEFDEVEVGWVLRPDVWGHGYASEAGGACVVWGFGHLDVDHLTAMIDPANTASIRVAQRLGFAPRRPVVFRGQRLTVHVLDRVWVPRTR